MKQLNCAFWIALMALTLQCVAGTGEAKELERGLAGRPVDIRERVDASNVRKYGVDKKISLTAWRGERVNAQVAVWSDVDQDELEATATDFTGANGAEIADKNVTPQFVRLTRTHFRPDKLDEKRDVADCLDPSADAWPKEGFRAIWFSLDVPAEAKPGKYVGAYTVEGDSGEVIFPVELEVVDRVLPPVKDRKVFLDLWQHPSTVAEYYGVKPFSRAHYKAMEPIYRQLATGPQKVITAAIVDMPWGEGYNDANGCIRSLVDYIQNEDGSYTADFTVFDEYIEFCYTCGLGPQIHCYSVVKFNEKHIFYYTHRKTGERRAYELYEGTKAYAQFMTPLLQQLEAHLVEKGWIDNAYIAIDEVMPERLPVVIEFVKKVAPKFKLALASTVDPFRYSSFEKEVDVYSQILWTGHGISNLFTKAFDDNFLAKRKREGKITTFYVCTQPQHPNTWFESPLVETEWLGYYAAAKGYDGFLRWAAFFWHGNPFTDPFSPEMPTGEVVLIYPNGLSSVRWEMLKDSLEGYEKIRILREQGSATPALEQALKALDYPFIDGGCDRQPNPCRLATLLDAIKREL